MHELQARCCVVGGGPAGVMLGFLLARAGVDTIVLEKHADFFRDFRGDTIHPSTFAIMQDLGLLDAFRAVPHDEITELGAQIGPDFVPLSSFASIPPVHALGLMPQWDFLNFLATQGRRYPTFCLLLETEATDLIDEDGIVRGVRVRTKGEDHAIRAELVVAADGRRSVLRERSGLPLRTFGAPIDVLWMRFSRAPDDPPQVLGRIDDGRLLIMLDRTSYWQCAFVIPKGAFGEMRSRPLAAFRDQVRAVAPFLRDRVNELRTWDDVSLLTVEVNRLERWYRPGFLCIGDAAHAMSPVGGVGINLALQDAVATANRLAPAFSRGTPSVRDLAAIQRRRTFPTVVIQRAQVLIQERLLRPILGTRGPLRAPLLLRVLAGFAPLRVIPAFLVGIGPRAERVRTADVFEGAHDRRA